MLTKLCFKIVPWSKGAFSQDVWLLVEDIIEDRQPQVWLTNVVDVRENQADMRANRIPVFQDLIVFSAYISPWLFDMVKDFFE